MKHLHLFESFNDKIIAYHITYKHKLKSILRNGLRPYIPADMEDTKAVYLFKTKEDAEEALMNWFGDRVEELEEELDREIETWLLTVDITGLPVVEGAGYEWLCPVKIEPIRIISTELI